MTRERHPLLVLDIIKFAGCAAAMIGAEALILSVPVHVAFERWLFLCAGAFLWALTFGNRSIKA